MVESATAVQVSKMSIQMAGVFTVLGIGLLYVYIAMADVSNGTKLLWASGLSLGMAFAFLIIWSLARDAIRQREREGQRKTSP
jgi:hypothetical protein